MFVRHVVLNGAALTVGMIIRRRSACMRPLGELWERYFQDNSVVGSVLQNDQDQADLAQGQVSSCRCGANVFELSCKRKYA